MTGPPSPLPICGGRRADGCRLAGTAVSALLLVAIFFLRDGFITANHVLMAGSLLVLLLSLFGPGWPSGALLRFWPYAAYGAALTIAFLLSRSAAAGQAYLQQATFLALVVAVARVARTAAAQRVLLAILLLSNALVLTAASLVSLFFEGTTRPVAYPTVPHWGGYPELGLLAGIGACGALGLVALGQPLALRLAAAGLTAFFLASSLLLYSRSAWITIAAVTVWMGIQTAARWRRFGGALLLVGLLGAGATALLLSPIGNRYLTTLTEVTGETTEVTSRMEAWNAALSMVRSRPWFGIGPGRYTEVYPTVTHRDNPSHAHNMVLHVAAEVGLVGAACFLIMWFYPMRDSLRLAVPTMSGAVAFALHGALAAFFVRSQGDHFLGELGASYRLLLLLGILFGLVEAMRSSCRIDD